jgi:ribosomal protein S18 acetylase RimI-like enzyme
MKLVRIRKVGLAKVVATGVRRYNGVSLSPRRILARPHYAITVHGHLAGWIGYEYRRPGVYEIAHLSVLPRFRRRKLGERATARVLVLVRNAGGHRVYARIRRANYAPQKLLRKFGFRRVTTGRVLRFVRNL